jgi:acetyl-CoA carboxylase biotin carboxyl carrier protein
MEFSDIERILELVRQHELAEFELEKEGLKLRVRKAAAPPVFNTGPMQPMPMMPMPSVPAAVPPPQLAAAPAAAPAPAEIDDDVELAVVKSPIVGTFYRTPEPGAPAFAEIGDAIRKNQVLCIIEAMKLMNEITSEYEGELVKVYVENGQPVQYGERLFAIKTS